MLLMMSCAVTSTTANDVGRGRGANSLSKSMHARHAASPTLLVADAALEKAQYMPLLNGNDTDSPLERTFKLRSLAQLRTATNPGKPAGSAEPAWAARIAVNAEPRTAMNPGKPAGGPGKPAGSPGKPAVSPGKPAATPGEPDGNGEPAGRIAVNETTGENTDYESHFAA
jgi:hypothetical protein